MNKKQVMSITFEYSDDLDIIDMRSNMDDIDLIKKYIERYGGGRLVAEVNLLGYKINHLIQLDDKNKEKR